MGQYNDDYGSLVWHTGEIYQREGRRKRGELYDGREMRIPEDATCGRLPTPRNEQCHLGGTQEHTGAHGDKF